MLAKTSNPLRPEGSMIAEGLPDFETVRVLCVGDVLLDRFVDGTVQRISPESPVPIILLGATQSVPGGAANVARNIASLGGLCTLLGAVGEDAAGRELDELLAQTSRIKPRLIRDGDRPTIEKTRFVAQGQHLLRADREDAGAISPRTEHDIVVEVARQLDQHDVVILSDYAKGLLTDTVISGVIGLARGAGVPVIVDPKSARLERYNGATVITPNVAETTLATGIAATDDISAAAAGQMALADAGVDAVLLTRAGQGMSLVRPHQPVVHIPASARDVYDVVGAGDTVVATLAVCLGAGMSLADAARLANAAAGIVVGKRGTATVSRSELIDELARMTHAGMTSPTTKTLDRDTAVKQARQWREEGLRVGFTNGCFDILHVGHAQLLEFARAHCDKLIVGLNADASVARLKGPSRPINPEGDRAELMGALGMIDAVVVFGEDTPETLIAELAPDLLVKGGDYTIDTVVGAQSVIDRGGQVLLFELVPGRSTTNVVARAATAA